MKKILFPLIISAFIACKNNTKSTEKDSISNAAATDPTQQLIKKFKPFIQGIWVKTDYIEDLTKSRSPYASRSYFFGIASIHIDMNFIKRDSMHVGYSLNNHEGGEFILNLKTGQKPTSLVTNLPDYKEGTNHYELGYNIKRSDTCLTLYHYSKNNHIIDSTNYTRVAITALDKDDAGWGIQYITNRKLISGQYNAIDSIGNIFKTKFDDNGNVSGFLNFKKYDVNTDFVAGPENNIDEIYFDVYSKNQISYAFKLNADTLNLYYTHDNADSTLLVLGKLKYKLIKQK